MLPRSTKNSKNNKQLNHWDENTKMKNQLLCKQEGYTMY